MLKEGAMLIHKREGIKIRIEEVGEKNIIGKKSNGSLVSIPINKLEEHFHVVKDDKESCMINLQAEVIEEMRRLLKEKNKTIKAQQINLNNIRKTIDLIQVDSKPSESDLLKIRFAAQVLIDRVESTSHEVHEFIRRCANKANVMITLGLEDNS